jgi:alpha-tubulin suppressor-like RCC1 family protein
LIAGLPSSIAQVRVISRTAGGCARTSAGAVWCWGQGIEGLTADPSRQSAATARQIALPFAAVEIGVGAGFACARSSTQVACWGPNHYGSLGATTASPVQTTPVLVQGLPATPSLSSLTSGEHGLCVIANLAPYCWGKLDGGSAMQATALPGAPLTTAITYRPSSLGYGHQCLLDQAGAAWCMGSNHHGELGRGTVGGDDPNLVMVTGGRTYSAIVAATGYLGVTCAIPTGNLAEVDCWGFYDNSDVPVPTPRTLSAIPVRLDATTHLVCATFADGTRDCVGSGFSGQLGDGTASEPSTFSHVAVAATALSLASDNACFVENDQVRCVGESRHGALGTPTAATPMRVPLACR